VDEMVEETSNILKELEKSIQDKKLKVGSKATIRALKQGNAVKVVYANNIPTKIKADIEYYSKLANVPAIEFSGNSKDLGVKCKRTHSALAAVIIKE
jgi:ribosomal protein L30E